LFALGQELRVFLARHGETRPPRPFGSFKTSQPSKEAAGSSRWMTVYVRVAKATEVPPGTTRVVVVQGFPVALFNVGGRFYATSNVCLTEEDPWGRGSSMGQLSRARC